MEWRLCVLQFNDLKSDIINYIARIERNTGCDVNNSNLLSEFSLIKQNVSFL